MNSRILTVLLLATAILYAQAISGANPAILDTDAPVLAKIIVSDIDSFASQWKTAPVQKLVKIAGKEIKVVTLTIDILSSKGGQMGQSQSYTTEAPPALLKLLQSRPTSSRSLLKPCQISRLETSLQRYAR
jgi:hypothetical protein